ncbi:hypothetical protein GQR58_030486 [Nymphon striatum]|nr:hypothetical protein GQR58_030486 [Nymphon striatum]
MRGQSNLRAELSIEHLVDLWMVDRQAAHRYGSFGAQQHRPGCVTGIDANFAIAAQSRGGHLDGFDHGAVPANHCTAAGNDWSAIGDNGYISGGSPNIHHESVVEPGEVQGANHAGSRTGQDGLDRSSASESRRNQRAVAPYHHDRSVDEVVGKYQGNCLIESVDRAQQPGIERGGKRPARDSIGGVVGRTAHVGMGVAKRITKRLAQELLVGRRTLRIKAQHFERPRHRISQGRGTQREPFEGAAQVAQKYVVAVGIALPANGATDDLHDIDSGLGLESACRVDGGQHILRRRGMCAFEVEMELVVWQPFQAMH